MFTPYQVDSWYALQIRPGREKRVCQALQQKGYQPFLPLYRTRRNWSDRTKFIDLPLFPGYIFSQCDPARPLAITTTPGVIGFVGAGRKAIAIESHEIDSVRSVVNSGLDVKPWPFLRPGRRVRIDRGPLRGLTGAILAIKRSYLLVVAINLLQRSVAVDLDPTWVSPDATASVEG